MRQLSVRYLTALMVATSAITAAACSDPVDAPTIDVTALDPGNFSVVPRDLSGLQDARYGPMREAVRLGEVLPLIGAIDARYRFQRHSRPDNRLRPGTSPALYGMDSTEFAAATPGLVVGWSSGAERRQQFGLGTSVTSEVIRFTDPAAAEAAAGRLVELQSRTAPGAFGPVAGLATARAGLNTAKRYLDLWLTRESLLFHVHIDDPVSEPLTREPLVESATGIVNALVEAARSYRPTPVEDFATLPVDVDGLLAHTMPPAGIEKARTDVWSMVLPAAAALHLSRWPTAMRAAFEDSGVDLVAVSDSRVYRTRDADAATRFQEALLEQSAADTRAIDAPPNLPIARCTEDADDRAGDSPSPTCVVVFDRFVAQISGSNIQELHQKTAAQYTLLAHRE